MFVFKMYLNVNSRDNVNIHYFHFFPVLDYEWCITWLVNGGLDDWVEMENTKLEKMFICNRHFSVNSFYSLRQLRKDAVPYLH